MCHCGDGGGGGGISPLHLVNPVFGTGYSS